MKEKTSSPFWFVPVVLVWMMPTSLRDFSSMRDQLVFENVMVSPGLTGPRQRILRMQASWFSEGKKTGQVALHFGADDFGGTLFEESVMLAAGFYNRATVEEVMTLIREAGFQPAQRTTLYEVIQRF